MKRSAALAVVFDPEDEARQGTGEEKVRGDEFPSIALTFFFNEFMLLYNYNVGGKL